MNQIEQMIWIGDGIRADGHEQIGRRVEIDGRTGTVIDGDALTITVKWDKQSTTKGKAT